MTERKALKRILGIKSGTTNDLIYNELNIPDLKCLIMNRQYNFFMKLMNMQENQAIAKSIWLLYKGNRISALRNTMISYYSNLQKCPAQLNIQDRKIRIESSPNSMCIRYKNITKMIRPNLLYNSMVDDIQRTIITRWRLSCHSLYIETGRYKTPPIPRNDRVCIICAILEDEHHSEGYKPNDREGGVEI